HTRRFCAIAWHRVPARARGPVPAGRASRRTRKGCTEEPMKKVLITAALVALAAAFASSASAKGQAPEDLLAGKIIISDQKLPMRWSSVGSYVSQLKGMNKGTLWYDKKTGKVRIEYAAFFSKPLDD